MKSRTTDRFRRCLAELPPRIRRLARESYALFREQPGHPGLRFKKVHPVRPIFSVRIGLHYRALAVQEGEDLIWFWIGSHANYDDLIHGGG